VAEVTLVINYDIRREHLYGPNPGVYLHARSGNGSALSRLAPVASTRVPVVEEIARAVGTVRGCRRKTGSSTVLGNGGTRQTDKRGKPPKRDPLVGRKSERGQVEPLWRLEVGLSGQPLIESVLIKEEFPTPPTMPTARRKFPDWRGKPFPLAPASEAVVGPSLLGAPPPQRGGPGRESGIRFCERHPPIIGYAGCGGNATPAGSG